MQHENLADIKHKLSIIYKHIQSMHNELRYQVKIHMKSEKLSKEKKYIKFCHLLPQYIYIYIEKKIRQKKQQRHAIRIKNNI
jgi:hypothetical protein